MGESPLPGNEEIEYNRIMSEMAEIYSTSTVCFDKNECLPLDPDLTEIMATSNNYALRTYVWKVYQFLRIIRKFAFAVF